MRRWAAALLLLPGVAFAQPTSPPDWDRFQMLMWQDHSAVQMQGLRALGFTGAKLRATMGGVDEAGKAAHRAAGLPWYLENLATDWYSPYHRYTPGKGVTWLMDAARAQYRAGDPAAFLRQPGLSDPAWAARVAQRLRDAVRGQGADRPLFYNLADEAGIADLAANWDLDLAPDSLAGFRDWLRGQYPSLDALNEQWGTAFAGWDAVVPELTDAAVRRADSNFSAWSDFKAWMDVAFARAVRSGTDALHGADPAARAALEGAQAPGWGGYDYTRLAPTVDVMEIYDFGQSLDLAQAFNPALIPLRTSFGAGPREAHATWRFLLHGGRGVVVWDEADTVVQADGAPGPRGREIAALLQRIALVQPSLRTARPAPDPVAVLYSPASFRVRWLLDRRAGDHDWAARDAEREYDDNAWRASRRVLLEHLAQLAVQPVHVAGADVAGLWGRGVRVLFLPHALALGDAEVRAIEAFRAAGGTVLADTEPGLFDGHGRRRAAPPLPDVPHPEAVRPLGEPSSPSSLAALAAVLAAAGAAPRATLLGPDGQRATGVEGRWFAGPQGTILSLHAMQPWGAPPFVTVQGVAARADLLRPGDVGATVVLDGIEPRVLSLR